MYKLSTTTWEKRIHFSLVLREWEEKKTQIFRTQDCSKYGNGRPGIFTSVQKLSNWIRITLNDIKMRNLDRVENDSNINRPMFFVILSMIGSVFLENK